MRVSKVQAVVMASVMLFIFIAGYNIGYPGLYYDELLFVNAALGAHSDLFIHRKLFDVPVMLMPYIGALKAWLYYPIFKVFDVSALSIRLPVILLGALTLWLNYRLVSLLFGTMTGVIFIILAAVEPTTIFHTRLDWGPTTLMMLFRSLLLLTIFHWIISGDKKYLLMALACCLVGVFDKVNFIWISAAVFASILIIYPSKIIEIINVEGKVRRSYIVILLSVLLLIAYLLRDISLLSEIGGFDYLSRFIYVNNMIVQMLAGNGVYSVVVGGSHDFITYQLILLALIISLSMMGIIYGYNNKTIEIRPVLFIFVFIAVVIIQMFFTKQATGTHHMATIAPLWLIPVSVGLSSVMKMGVGNVISHGKLVVIAMAGLLFVSSVLVAWSYHDSIKGRVQPRWDVVTYGFSHKIDPELSKTVISVDWGSATIIQGVLQDKIKVIDFWPWFNDGIDGVNLEWFEKEFLVKGTVFVVSSPGMESFPKTRINFLELINDRKWKVERIETMHNSEGLVMYELYYIN